MTERGSVHVERATTCPFVAFDDDRDERADLPDHRHRCYPATPPAPRALAHQEAYCLSAGFPACPVFQDWAKREAARTSPESTARATSSRPAERPAAAASDVAVDDDRLELSAADEVAVSPSAVGAATPGGEADDDTDDPPIRDPRVREVDPWDDDPLARPRQVHRDWAEPPPWAAGAAGAGSGAAAGTQSRGMQPDDGSVPDRPRAPEGAGLTASRWLVDGPTGRQPDGEHSARDLDAEAPGSGRPDDPARTPGFLHTREDGRSRLDSDSSDGERDAAAPRPELAGLAGRPRSDAAGRLDAARRPQASARPSGADRGRVLGQARPARRVDRDEGTPAWERPRRFEAYPTLKTRMAMPALPPMILAVAALVVAALLLFFVVPGLFIGGGQVSQTSPVPSASTSATRAPTPTPAPTAETYTVKAGDTLTSIAHRFGLTQNQLLKANPQVKDPNKIAVGDVLTIPTKTSGGGGGVITSAPSTSPSDSSAP